MNSVTFFEKKGLHKVSDLKQLNEEEIGVLTANLDPVSVQTVRKYKMAANNTGADPQWTDGAFIGWNSDRKMIDENTLLKDIRSISVPIPTASLPPLRRELHKVSDNQQHKFTDAEEEFFQLHDLFMHEVQAQRTHDQQCLCIRTSRMDYETKTITLRLRESVPQEEFDRTCAILRDCLPGIADYRILRENYVEMVEIPNTLSRRGCSRCTIS